MDLIGLKLKNNKADYSEIAEYITQKDGVFYNRLMQEKENFKQKKLHFFYAPNLSKKEEILKISDQGQYDAVIAAATFLPSQSVFKAGGVRIGAGTGNMLSNSWGGADGLNGEAPLMNTPSFNSRATAQNGF